MENWSDKLTKGYLAFPCFQEGHVIDSVTVEKGRAWSNKRVNSRRTIGYSLIYQLIYIFDVKLISYIKKWKKHCVVQNSETAYHIVGSSQGISWAHFKQIHAKVILLFLWQKSELQNHWLSIALWRNGTATIKVDKVLER